ncbi:MAG: hypothetical protein M3Y56_12695, partial [Armatimonadota bacterium]|nr:hypothetical protein [Armatimonadota bacterium]
IRVVMLSVDGALDLEVEGEKARLTSVKDQLSLDVARPRSFFAAAGLLNVRGLGVLRSVAAALHQAGLTLTVSKKGKALLVLGRDARPGVEGWILQAPFVQILRGGTLLRFFSA